MQTPISPDMHTETYTEAETLYYFEFIINPTIHIIFTLLRELADFSTLFVIVILISFESQ